MNSSTNPPHNWGELQFDPAAVPGFWSSLRADLHAHLPESERFADSIRRHLAELGVVLRTPGLRLTLLYRLSAAFRRRLGVPGKIVATLLFTFARHFYGCSISPAAQLHGGLVLPHPQGIVIGPGVVLGPRAWVFQNVTIGGAPGRAGAPVIGTDARIYPGAVLSGPISVGWNVVVGANAVVVRDVPAQSLVRSPVAECAPLPNHLIVDDVMNSDSDRAP